MFIEITMNSSSKRIPWGRGCDTPQAGSIFVHEAVAPRALPKRPQKQGRSLDPTDGRALGSTGQRTGEDAWPGIKAGLEDLTVWEREKVKQSRKGSDRARQACPICSTRLELPSSLPKAKEVIHRSFEDPAGAVGSEEEQLLAFRRVRDEIADWISQKFRR